MKELTEEYMLTELYVRIHYIRGACETYIYQADAACDIDSLKKTLESIRSMIADLNNSLE